VVTAKHNLYVFNISRKYLFILAGLILAVLIFRVIGFKDRWFEPIFISLPLLLFAVGKNWVQTLHFKQISILGGVVALAILTIIPGRIVWAEQVGRPQLLNAPFDKMARDLDAAIPLDALIIAESKWIGGNLRMQFPSRNIVTPELAKLYSATNRQCIVVWNAMKNEMPPARLVTFVENFTGAKLNAGKQIYVGTTYRHYREEKFRLGILLVEN
jgi:hypothetical protein